MMKCEFEEMIGKEVTAETYAIYEAMYMAAHETVDKKTFVSMLNIEAIPEDPEAIERRKEEEARREEIRAEIADQRELIEYNKWRRDLYSEKLDDFEKREYKWYTDQIKKAKAKIRELKWLLTA